MRFFRFVTFCCSFFLCFTLFSPTNKYPSLSASALALDDSSLIQPFEALSNAQSLVQSTQGSATGPLFVNPDNPRYFTDGTLSSGQYKVIFLTGSHTWCDFMDCDDSASIPAKFDYSAYLDFLVSNNHNFFRLWRAENVRGGENGDNFWFDPMPYQRSATCCAFDGKNKFNLNQFNQVYFDRMRQRVIQARDRGIYVSIMLFDGWSVETKFPSTHQPWKGHPYKLSNNINNVNGDLNNDSQGGETHTLASAQITSLQEAYVRKVIDTVNDLDNVLYEISNESSGGTANREWQYHMINFIKAYESTKPKQHPVGMTVPWPNGNNMDLYNSPADWISPNGDVTNPTEATGSKVVLADTDHLCGICGDRFWVWKSFTRGENPIFMDIYDNATSGRGIPFANPNEVEIRNNLGYVRSLSQSVNLTNLTPHSDLCSSKYCLANPSTNGAEYLVYLPSGGSVTVDLSATDKSLSVEWINPTLGIIMFVRDTVAGGGNRVFTAPFPGDAVLHIFDMGPLSPAPPNQTAIPLISMPTLTETSVYALTEQVSTPAMTTPIENIVPTPARQNDLSLLSSSSGFAIISTLPPHSDIDVQSVSSSSEANDPLFLSPYMTLEAKSTSLVLPTEKITSELIPGYENTPLPPQVSIAVPDIGPTIYAQAFPVPTAAQVSTSMEQAMTNTYEDGLFIIIVIIFLVGISYTVTWMWSRNVK